MKTSAARPEGLKAGGQAVIEGVMMRTPHSAAVAVRAPGGKILARKMKMTQLTEKGGLWAKPVFRGAAVLMDTLRLGMKALSWSAEVAEMGSGNENGPSKRTGDGAGTFLSTAMAVVLAMILFAWLPLQGSKWLLEPGGTTGPMGQFAVHLLAGVFRIAAFLVYVASISLIPDIRRIFIYHGAEHQTIHAWEKGLEPLADAAEKESPLHQRCGTSFLLLVMLGAVVFYGILDSLVILVTGSNPSAVVRVLYHLPMMPLVMGLSYEVLKVADRYLETSVLARMVTAPGLLLQKMTTRKAGLPEVEVALASLRLALGEDPGEGVTVLESKGDPDERG